MKGRSPWASLMAWFVYAVSCNICTCKKDPVTHIKPLTRHERRKNISNNINHTQLHTCKINHAHLSDKTAPFGIDLNTTSWVLSRFSIKYQKCTSNSTLRRHP
eukprot:scaffold57743_cov50-Cyclotella_meneghiniana.AAC.1